MQRTELNEIGEFALIEKIKQSSTLRNPESIQGIGDDAAVMDYGGSQYTLLSTDMLVEGIHFDLSYCPLKHIGYKAVSVNVSDIVAMNGVAKQITVSIGVSNRFSVEAIEELYKGIHFACKNYNIDLVGGDTTSSHKGLIISISVMGLVDKDKVAYRQGAKDKEIICVTGDLGGAYLGLQVLEREKQVFLANPDMQPELSGKDYILQRQLSPDARSNFIAEFAQLDLVPTSMIDISDGLASDLMHLCQSSGVGAMLFEEKLPIEALSYEQAIEFNLSPTTCALNGGEDYELLFTVKQEDFPKIEQHPHISHIGYVQDKSLGVSLTTRAEQVVPIEAQGFKHF